MIRGGLPPIASILLRAKTKHGTRSSTTASSAANSVAASSSCHEVATSRPSQLHLPQHTPGRSGLQIPRMIAADPTSLIARLRQLRLSRAGGEVLRLVYDGHDERGDGGSNGR